MNAVGNFNFLKHLVTFFPEFYFGNGQSSSLLNITLELTHRCNLDCIMCNYGGSKSSGKDNAGEINLETIKHIVRQGAEFRASFFLTGGEPFLRHDLIEIVKTIKDYKLKCGINTNGTMIDKKKILSLVDLNLDYIIFSILGPENVHDNLVDSPGAYKKMADNLKLFSNLRKGTKIFLNQVITRENLGFLKETVFLAKNTAIDGIRYQHLSYLTSEDIESFSAVRKKIPKDYETELSCKKYDHYDFPYKEAYREIKDTIRTARNNRVSVIFRPSLGQSGMKDWYADGLSSTKRCVYPWVAIRIAPNGDLFPCQVILLKIGNIKNSSIKELLNNQRFKLFRNLLKSEKGQFSICSRCCKLHMSPIGRS